MTMRPALLIGIASLILALIARPAFAQDDRPVEIAAGYLNVMGTMHGWNAHVSKDLTPHVAVLFEVNRSRGADCQDCEPICSSPFPLTRGTRASRRSLGHTRGGVPPRTGR